MGIINNYLSTLYIEDMHYSVATEAEDISGEAETTASGAFGKQNKKDSDTSIDTDTDDVLGTSTNDKDSDIPDEDDDESVDDTSNDTNSVDEDDDMGDSEDDDIEDNAATNEDNTDDFKRKAALHENMIYLYDILQFNINSIEEYSPSSNEEENITTLQNIKSNLDETHNILGKILTNEFKDASYPYLLRKYIAIKQIHSVTIEMLDRYFIKLADEFRNNEKKKTVKKPKNEAKVK